jgi:hypothetical protein
MKLNNTITSLTLAVSLFGLSVGSALADEGKGKKGHWNPAPPKKNGRHDNRNWNKGPDVKVYDGVKYGSAASIQSLADRRNQTKNEWRNIAYLSGAVAVLGLLKKDNTLVFAGTAGALYSLYRYEQDRKSASQLNRLRASYFSRPYFYRDGKKYERRLVVRNGVKYYQFVRR